VNKVSFGIAAGQVCLAVASRRVNRKIVLLVFLLATYLGTKKEC
jgi:hypothetical protein